MEEPLGCKPDTFCITLPACREIGGRGDSVTNGKTLSERVAELAAEATAERERLEEKRRRLIVVRDAAITRAREECARQTDEIKAELAAITRLEHALAPPKPKRRKSRDEAKGTPGAPSQKWRPKEDVMLAVLQAMTGGAETVNEIADAVPYSSTTVKLALDWLREDGRVRLAGSRPKPARGNGVGPRVYRATPEGHEHLRINTTNGAPDVVANA